jgi:hypothetical protein
MKNNPLNTGKNNTKFIGEIENITPFKDFVSIELGCR